MNIKDREPIVLASNDLGATWRACEVLDEVQDNLAEIKRRYRAYQRKLAIRYGSLFLIGLIVSYLVLRVLLWM